MVSNTSHIIVSILILVAIVGLSFVYVNFISNSSSIIPKEPWLGISVIELTPRIADALGLQDSSGLLVLQVAPRGPADRAGIRGGGDNLTDIDQMDIPFGGDVIIEIDGNAVKNLNDFRSYLDKKEIGDSVEFAIIRDNNFNIIDVILEERPG